VANTGPYLPTAETAREALRRFGSPLYLYDEATLRDRASEVLAFGGPFGFTARFAIKANPTRSVLRLFDGLGLHFDASSVHEAERAIRAGVAPQKIQLTAQILAGGWQDLVRRGVSVTACSVLQLDLLGREFPGGTFGVRFNPGAGSGHNNRTSVAGSDASFGVWHEQLDDVLRVASQHRVRLAHVHHHVGSGGEGAKWAEIATATLALVRDLPDATTVNLGGGFKVARMPGEHDTDLVTAAGAAHALLRRFAANTGRELHLEVEPGTYLSADAGAIVGRVHDVVSTGAAGHVFVRTDIGMAEILRPALYGAQHPVTVLAAHAGGKLGTAEPLLFVGPCCESGDILTPARGDPEGLAPRTLPRPAAGDVVVVGGAGAYCASMPAKHYNSIPAAPEVWRDPAGNLRVVRERESLDDLLRHELE